MKPIYCKFSNDRDKKFQIRTTIELNDEGQREVVKQAVSQESVTHIQEMYHNYKRMCESYKDTVFRANMCNLVGDSVHFEFLEGRTFENILDDLYKKRRFIEIIDKDCHIYNRPCILYIMDCRVCCLHGVYGGLLWKAV